MLEMGYSSSSSHLLKRFRVASPEKEMLLSLRCLKWKKVFFLSREWNIWPGQRYSKIPAGQVSHLASSTQEDNATPKKGKYFKPR